MITLDQAHAILQQTLAPLPMIACPLGDANGQVLAEPVRARLTQPPFPASAMDGYAVRSADLNSHTVSLFVVGESAAGHAFEGRLGEGQAVRISTGAVLPEGADQIIIQENTRRDGERVITAQPAGAGAHIREAGQDFETGQLLLERGHRLTPDALSLIAASGHDTVPVVRRPKIGILASGDELVEPGRTPSAGQIINSITSGLSALIAQWGAEPVYLGIAGDTEKSIADKLDTAPELDLIVPVGGASVGEHDHMRRVIEARGGVLKFEKIAVRPGKPTWFAMMPDGTAMIGLPGNPVSALVMARLVLRNAVRILRGETPHTPRILMKLTATMPANGDRETYVRGVRNDDENCVTPLPRQDSAILTTLVTANALIRRTIGAQAADKGEVIEVIALD
ncbi:gephyrin-like molybdotransferase Glp [Maricaulis parjimensis]|uniref:molybdopterin molybdotransferase MoeA n=1 Tax=Maricaulis parjimensis TaxID=144023 RepID=UPI00193A7307|nr:gephyrin-like molybdotransferase Glp [Maricaulis parjimensis]